MPVPWDQTSTGVWVFGPVKSAVDGTASTLVTQTDPILALARDPERAPIVSDDLSDRTVVFVEP
jgi:hypothetical protein